MELLPKASPAQLEEVHQGHNGVWWGRKNRASRDFPGGPVVKTPCFQARGYGSIPGWGTNFPHALWHGEKKMGLVIKDN